MLMNSTKQAIRKSVIAGVLEVSQVLKLRYERHETCPERGRLVSLLCPHEEGEEIVSMKVPLAENQVLCFSYSRGRYLAAQFEAPHMFEALPPERVVGQFSKFLL